MTQQTEPAKSVQLVALADTRLAALQAAYPAAKSEADAASARLKEITDGIKAELSQAAPGAERVDLAAAGDAPGLTLAYAERVTLDTRKLKAEDPETYVRYAKFGGAWSLRAAGSGS